MALAKEHQTSLEFPTLYNIGALPPCQGSNRVFCVAIKSNLRTFMHRFYMLHTKALRLIETLKNEFAISNGFRNRHLSLNRDTKIGDLQLYG